MALEVTVLGCGEAFDEAYTNTSLLVRAAGKTMLLDCGYSAPAPLWNALRDHHALDLIYISHPHADHYLGMPAVLGRMWEEGREKPLVIVSQPPALRLIRDAMDNGYPGLSARFKYPIEYREALPGQALEWHGLGFGFAPTRHSVTNLAVRIHAEDLTFCYSGDGQFTDESRALFTRADLLIHEAYSFDPSPVHGDINGVVRMAADQGVARLALVHIQRKVRRTERDRIEQSVRSGIQPGVSVPEPGDRFAL